MKRELFKKLLDSVNEAAAIERGIQAPSRSFKIKSGCDLSSVRAKLHPSQTKFASLMGIGEDKLQNWEQRRRKPSGPGQSPPAPCRLNSRRGA